MSEERMVEAARRLSRAITPGDLDHTLSQITAAAVEVLPEVEYASITVVHADGRIETVAPTDELVLGVDEAQYELREGPCYEAAVDTVHVTAPNLAADERFPRYAAAAVAAGIRAQAAVRLFDAPKSNGALNLYSRHIGAFEDLGSLRELFVHQSAMAIEYAQEIHNLRQAVRTRQTIGQAIGIVMERYQLTDQRAFAFLTRLSQHGNVKLRQVAQEIVAAVHRQADDTTRPESGDPGRETPGSSGPDRR
jgi:ANTAR domain/GAF domain